MMDISIDGVKLGDIGIRVKESSSYLGLPATRDNVVSIPGRHGAYPLGSWLEPRTINLHCRISNKKNTTEIAETVRMLATLLLDQYGRTKEVKLVMGHEPEKYYKVKYVGAIPVDKQAHTGDFELPFIAYDPFAYAPATYYDPDFVPSYDTSVEYDSGVEYVNQTSTPFNNIRQYAGIFNYSHYATPFSFVIEGYVKNPKITNLTSGKSAQLNITVEADERLYFDSKLMTTWKVKAAEDKYFWLTPYQIMKHEAKWEKINKYNDMSGDFLELVSGKNSILFEGENPNAYVNFNWEHRFL